MNDKMAIDSLQAIFFDFDGVLCECMNVKTEAFAELYRPYGEEIVKKVVKHHVENGGISRYRKIRFYHKEYLNKLITEDEVEELAKKFSNLVIDKVISSKLVDGIEKFLEKYHKIIDLYIISGTPQEEIELVVEKKGMKKYFKEIHGSPIKKPEHIMRIISEKNYKPEKVVYVGDSLSDMRDAEAANVPFLGRVLPGYDVYFPKNVKYVHDFKKTNITLLIKILFSKKKISVSDE
jgi:HAD superfamily hydrolase (TIGR01549 family)